MVRRTFYQNRIWRQRSSSLIVKSLNRFENDLPVVFGSSSSSSPESHAGTYKTTTRSAYSVLRSRNTPPDVCAQNLISSSDASVPISMMRCCCTALIYRSSEQLMPFSAEKDRERDDFVFSLKLASVEQPLRDLVGEERYVALVGSALSQAQQVGLCQELPQLDEGSWVARLLLTPEEDNRVKWLREDGVLSSTTFARVPSFKAMYVAYHVSGELPLDVRQFENIEERMRENKVEWDMCDAAVACTFAMKSENFRPYFCHIVQNKLLRDGNEESANTEISKEPEVGFRHVLGAILLLQCFRELHSEAQEAGGHLINPPTYLFAVATQLFSLVASLPPTDLSYILEILSKSCRTSALSLANICIVPSESPLLPTFTLWLLKEAPYTVTCHHHFRRMILRSQTEALSLLEKSSLLSNKSIDLQVVDTVLLPLLDGCGHEEFFYRVIREVLTGMEERLRRDPQSFTQNDIRYIALLGARLFDMQPQDRLHTHNHHHASGSAFDATAREQMEELRVMDGSPWALVALSYNYLKEIVMTIVRDHRQLRKQVEAQMRNIVEAVTADTPSSNTGNLQSTTTTTGTVGVKSSCGDEKGGSTHYSQNFSPDAETHMNSPSAVASTRESNSNTCNNDNSNKNSDNSSKNKINSMGNSCEMDSTPLRSPAPPSLRQRFVAFVEELVKALVDETGANRQNCFVVSNELFAFVNQHVPVPNIHDEYRRKIFLLVNVAPDKSSVKSNNNGNTTNSMSHIDSNNTKETEDEIPAELRLLVTSLPLTLSPWASVMILREVLSESAGNNPRYTYVLNAAIDLQLPISTTRSRIATTLNMWRFLSSQAEKLTVSERLNMKQRCVLNLPLSYIMSSYWSLLTWMALLTIVGLNVVGLDFESQYVATRLFQEFAPSDDVLPPVKDEWNIEGAKEVVSIYLEDPDLSIIDGEPHHHNMKKKHSRTSSEVLLSSASYIFLGTDDQRRPMTLIQISSEASLTPVERVAEESLCASAVLRELSRELPFPFYLPIEQPLSVELIVSRVAERIRRISFNNAWFVSRMIFRTFPLGRYHTEYGLVSHTCTQANLIRRRMTFLLYVHQSVPLTPQLLSRLHESVLAQHGNLVIVAHEDSLVRGGTTAEAVQSLTKDGVFRNIPYNKRWAKTGEIRSQDDSTLGPRWPKTIERLYGEALGLWGGCTREIVAGTHALTRKLKRCCPF
ncbi:putative dolicholphosphate-mannose synthase [Trypanosoma theileri]|uniref:Putative dolicholphosphate-mannose synthase n=1 Tax=Trypanosoma theileri TaxID=67003 RepID=A0A1X0NZM2_9TRYP|nr:putative dolicholphosphate-mannose synthase [Trypanosoma theileri]ORC90137.1 putative dolicholphosphate-mannose synthase [Trypanosoma theileri]